MKSVHTFIRLSGAAVMLAALLFTLAGQENSGSAPGADGARQRVAGDAEALTAAVYVAE